jgi:hypothetical protein
MRRSLMAGVLAASALLGGGTGAVAHEQWPGPFQRSPQGTRTSAPATTPTPAAQATSMPTPTPTSTPTSSTNAPRPSASAATPLDEPAFTTLSLLTPREFLERGWGAARLVDRFDQIPSPAITPCVTVPPGTEGLRTGYAATYASERTEAAEVVARFDTSADAADEFDAMRATVAGCADASAPTGRLRMVAAHHPTPTGTSELRWWNTRPLDDGPARGVLGLVRVDDRVAVLTLRSDVSDPAKTTKIESLLVQAGRRLS